jgi:DNA-binding CsgD family transcriptional regulator
MSSGSPQVGLCEQDSHNVTRTQAEKFAIAANILNIIGSLYCGGVLLGPQRRVLCLNPIAADCFGNGLILSGNRLIATDRQSNARLQGAVGLAMSEAESAGVPATWLEVRRAANVPLLIRILRLQESVRPVLIGASLLLVIVDPQSRQAPRADLLTQVFALTNAEAEVAIAIAHGRRVAQIAADRSVAVATVRTHAKMALAKTRTRSQAELAVLLTRLAFAAPRDEAGVQ